MKAIILAAGRGTRMGYLTKDKPKCLLKFLGKTLLERQIEAFRDSGIRDVIVVTGYRSDKIGAPDCIKVKNEKYATTNMIESLFCTRRYWNDAIVVSYGDIVYERAVLKKVIDSADGVNVAVDINGAAYFKERFGKGFLFKSESLVMGRDGSILDIGEPNPDIRNMQGQYIGLMKFNETGIKILSKVYCQDKERYWNKPWLRSKNFRNGCMTDMLQRIIDKGYRVSAVKVRGGWLEFDSIRDYKKYAEWHKKRLLARYYEPD